MARTDLTAQRLRELLHYDPETGAFTNRCDRRGRIKAGTPAGWMYNTGYHGITVDGYDFLAHRLAWLYMSGEWPRDTIDHINGDRMDNRIANLRDVSKAGNSQNQRRAHSDSRSGLLGIYWCKYHGTWIAQIKVDGKLKKVGRSADPKEAHAMYLAAKRRLHEGCTI